jgi:putative ABC transport system permease protein
VFRIAAGRNADEAQTMLGERYDAIVCYRAAEKYLGLDGHPTTIYVRSVTSQKAAVQSVLAATANPEAPNEVNVSQPSAALSARAAAKGALNGLFLGLGAVSLLVGAVGVANIMIISVLERRSEIGPRRALGATKGHIRTQFLSEAPCSPCSPRSPRSPRSAASPASRSG